MSKREMLSRGQWIAYFVLFGVLVGAVSLSAWVVNH
jgi:hypothetical protein